MKITKIEVVQNSKPVPLPGTWRMSWNEPDGPTMDSVGFSFILIHTDAGITGIGPHSGRFPMFTEELLIGQDPLYIGRVFDTWMRGHGAPLTAPTAGGIDIALWDIAGKAAGLPIYKLLGASRDKVMAYAATSQLHDRKTSVELARQARDEGFKGMKLRMHRQDPWEDVKVVSRVIKAVGDDMAIMVDANQNNFSYSYNFWDRTTALAITKALDALGIYWIEEPLPKRDLAGLAELCAQLDTRIVGGEHCAHLYEFRDVMMAGAYDWIQPDPMLGSLGITGLVKTVTLADALGHRVVPHICGGGTNGIAMAAVLHVMGACADIPWLEYTWDMPVLGPDTLQGILKTKIKADAEGMVQIPQGPGLGIELDWEFIDQYR